MAVGRKTGGRQKGTPNKMSKTVKDNVLSVFDEIGGTDEMALWAADNRTEFYRLYSKLLPIESQISGPDGGDIPVSFNVVYVEPED